MSKFIFITGGVVSGLGKGITGSSLGMLLKNSGLKVYMQKLDPYLNIDPGTMSPYEHGEVFVTDDGGETDLDLGHYERFIDENLSKNASKSSGRIFLDILEAERRGDWNGKTVQVIPHITDAIKNTIYGAVKDSNADVIITEVGGTVGDIESQPFIEAIRQIRMEQGKENSMFIHVGLLPYISASKEYKTKPIQHSVKEMTGMGIQPDIIVTRSDNYPQKGINEKIALFCNVPVSNVISAIDMDSIYKVPAEMKEQNLHQIVIDQLNLKTKELDFKSWEMFINKIETAEEEVNIAIVGKYIEMPDTYLSVIESLKISGYEFGNKVEINWVQAENINDQNVKEQLSIYDGILIPGGFGDRGVEGMIIAAKFARENNVPYLGICLGMQVASIEFARNVLGLTDSNSTEFNKDCKNPIIDFIPGIDKENIGGTLRLGKSKTTLKSGSVAKKLYGSKEAFERHRHRYEFNNDYREQFENAGLVFSGVFEEKNLVEIIELPNNKFFIGAQFHPEFTSRPNKPNALFKGFVEASIKNKK